MKTKFIIVVLLSIAFFTSCVPCNKAARLIARAQVICPTVASKDSQDVMVKISALDAEISIERNDTILKLMTRNLAIQIRDAKSDTARYRVIERFIQENCLERDTTNFIFDDGTVKLFLTNGKINVSLHVNDRQAQVRAPITNINPTVVDNADAWVMGIIALALFIILVLVLVNRRRQI